jgi:TonB family protein
MRHHLLHIAAALLAFTVVFLTADSYENLAYALPLALAVFLFTKLIPKLHFDLHFLMVATLSLFMWVMGAGALYSMLQPNEFDCVLEFSESDMNAAPNETEPGGALTNSEESSGASLPGLTVFSCDATSVTPAAHNSMWAGALDKKATAKPKPFYPLAARAAGVEGTVAVHVIIDEAGRVVWAQAISGHAMLRQSAMDAACYARFAPTLMSAPPVRVSGVLTYDFTP